MPSLNNSTLSSSPDRDDCQYWSSFSEKPFCCGDRLQLYKGKLNGKGPRVGDFSVAKVFVDRPGTESRCNEELAKAEAASELLTYFLECGRFSPERARCAQLQKAPMDQVSMLNKFFAHNKRRPSSGEWILLEEMVEGKGDLLLFMDQHGRMCRERAGVGSRSRSDPCPCLGSPSSSCRLDDSRQLLEAFVHFTHAVSGGRAVVCGLEGLHNDRGQLLLKTPVLHSADKAYGETDLGMDGVQEVMSRHVCNRHCRKMLGLRHQPRSAPALMQSPRPPPSSPLHFSRRPPSAPFDPEVFFGNDVTDRWRSVGQAPPYDPDLSIDVSRLPLDVFASPTDPAVDWRLLFQPQLAKAVPDDPPPPYSELIEDLL